MVSLRFSSPRLTSLDDGALARPGFNAESVVPLCFLLLGVIVSTALAFSMTSFCVLNLLGLGRFMSSSSSMGMVAALEASRASMAFCNCCFDGRDPDGPRTIDEGER